MSCVKQTTKKYTSRPSPPYPANECQGLTKTGNDGQLYQSVANIKGVFQWKLTTKTTKTPTSHRIYFCEPYTTKRDYLKSRKSIFKVNEKFYQTLLKKPKYVMKNDGNAYIFGPKFPLKDYQFLTGHGNDGAQTGLLDYDLWMKSPEEQASSDLWHKLYLQKGLTRWDTRKNLLKMREKFPEILFVGETLGGDVGADMWIHRDKKGEIDSLIIENHCMFKNLIQNSP